MPFISTLFSTMQAGTVEPAQPLLNSESMSMLIATMPYSWLATVAPAVPVAQSTVRRIRFGDGKPTPNPPADTAAVNRLVGHTVVFGEATFDVEGLAASRALLLQPPETVPQKVGTGTSKPRSKTLVWALKSGIATPSRADDWKSLRPCAPSFGSL